MEITIAYLSLGAMAGLLAGLLGVGGGLVVVPVLLFLYLFQGFPAQHAMHLAVGSSLMTVVFTSVASAASHHHHGVVRWAAVAALVPGIVVGALLGAGLAELISGHALRSVFGLFELVVAAQLLLGFRPAPHRELPVGLPLAVTGAGIGALSALLGIGGGTLSVPFLLWCNVSMHQAVGTSAACGLPIALAGAAGFIATGWDEPGLPPWSSGYVYWPAVASVVAGSALFAPLGARLAHRMRVASLKRAFAGVLAIIGLRMLG